MLDVDMETSRILGLIVTCGNYGDIFIFVI
jgi:hypothetical protein